MNKLIWVLVAGLSTLAGTVMAEVPRVAVDIRPVHSLAARVMQGLGEPALVVRPGASPHGYAMRPSEAAALDRADVVFYVSGDLTRWFERALGPLAGRAVAVELLQSPGSQRLETRVDALFEKRHKRAHGEETHDEDAHGHDEDAHEDEHGHDEQAHEEDTHAHGHFGLDPHGWLDPENAKAWLTVMAGTLAEADPENAATYRANAAAGRDEIDAAEARARVLLQPVADVPFFVHHDAYQYFEHRFGLQAAGAVSGSDATQPGPRRVAALRAAVDKIDAVCIFSEPQFNPALLATVFEGKALRKASLDPLGTTLEAGPGLYPALIEQLAADIAACLGGG